MKAEDVMTPTPIYIDENDTLQDAVSLMLHHRISGLRVLGGQDIG